METTNQLHIVYRCPNGHPYVIGDCGGATQAASCPECGARIGGTGHQLTSGNTQHQELASLAGPRVTFLIASLRIEVNRCTIENTASSELWFVKIVVCCMNISTKCLDKYHVHA